MSDERLAELARLIETGGGRPIYADEAAELLAEVEALRAPAQLGSALVEAVPDENDGAALCIAPSGTAWIARHGGSGPTDATRRLSALLAAFPQEGSRG